MDVRPEHPRPQATRAAWLNLNGAWGFGAGEHPAFDRDIVVPFCPQSALSGIGEIDPGDVVWYRRRFDAPRADRLLLHFGAVDYRATVWIDGEEVVRHEGGHTPFSADISRWAGRRDVELVVRAEDPLADRTIPRGKQHWTAEPEGIFYTPTTGIWQTVWLEPLPAVHVESVHVRGDLDAGSVHVEVSEDVDCVATFAGRVAGSRRGPGTIALDEVHPWSPETPNLYDLRLTRGADVVDTYFGLRKVETHDRRFWLNGEPYIQRLVLDQGYFPGGLMTAASDADLRRDVELAKALGFNGVRKHQKLEDPRWLYWADVLGLLVWGEMPSRRAPSAQGEARFLDEWAAAVRRDAMHPCIAVWAPVNESDGLGAGAAPFLERVYALTRRLDPTRPVVSNDGWEHAKTDLCTLHDYASPAELARRYRDLGAALEPGGRARPPYLPGYAYSGEPVVVSECGGFALAGAGGYNYGEVAGPEALRDAYRELVQALMAPGPVEGFCYTQLTDVEQERNGLLTFERRPKVDPAAVREITRTPKRR